MKEDESKEYYVSMQVPEKLRDGIVKLGDYSRRIKKNKNSIYSLKYRRAEIRKEIYEKLVSLRLGLDKFKSLLPEHEAKMLEEKLKLISNHVKEEKEKKRREKELKKEKKKKIRGLCPYCGKRFKRLDLHKPYCDEKEKEEEKRIDKEEDLRLDSEKRELEMLRKDLENISAEIENRRK